MSILSRPQALGRQAKISNVDDVDAGLHELAWLSHRRKIIEARAQQKIDAIKAEADQEMAIEFGNSSVSFTDRARVLASNITTFVMDNLPTILTGKAKSKELPHGKVGTRKSPDVIAFESDESVLAAIDSKLALIDKAGTVQALRERLFMINVGGLPLGSLVTINVAVNKSACKQVWDNLAAKRPELEALGITLQTGATNPVVEPAEYVVTNDEDA